MVKPTQSKGPELLKELAQHVSHLLIELIECQPDLASHVGHEISRRMADHWGGQLVYFPIGDFERCARDLEIWTKFTGRNHSDLAREYGVSVAWVYKIVKEMRAQDTAQGRLFTS